MPPTTPLLSTRERILAYLRENRVASVHSLSHAWRLTPADIRYHLNALEEEGLIELVPREDLKPLGRGRPGHVYRIAPTVSPNNFAGLCAGLLGMLLEGASPTDADARLQRLAGELAGGRSCAGNALQRYNQLVEHLNRDGYRARWEAHASGPRVLLRSCPYAAILEQHPELCQMDRHLLERLAGFPFQQVAQMNFRSGTPPACVFIPLGLLVS